MIDCRFKPLHQWPRKMTADRKNATFRASYPDTLNLLESELDKLDAAEIIVQVAMRPEDIRNDGWPRANARKPSHPGVVVSFRSSKGPLSFACDTFWEWEDNLRAIAKTLENLRAVERYGATKHGEQYRGYAAIESKAADTFSSVEDAACWLAGQSGLIHFKDAHDAILKDAAVLAEAFRAAARRLHPDAGGTTEGFQKLQQAKALLDAHHGGPL